MHLIPSATPYPDARRALLEPATERGAVVTGYAHPATGPDGEDLATDVLRFGAPPGRARDVLVVMSGVHGVEGHAGNGLQRLLVTSGRLEALPPATAVVLVHAVNPYGFAWTRRVDAENVDVNRNFVDYSDLPANPLYEEVDPLLNPTDPDLDPEDPAFLGGIAEFAARVGEDRAFRTLAGGQYTHPAGVQYGGRRPSWSRQMLERMWGEQLVGARRAVCLDVHTGLGPKGQLTVFQTADEGEAAAEMGDAWYATRLFRSPRSEEDPVDHGLIGPGFDAWAGARADRPATATFVLELGTLDPVSGLVAFRADNWLHTRADPTGPAAPVVVRRMLDHFFVDEDGWRAAVAEQGSEAIHTALDALGHV